LGAKSSKKISCLSCKSLTDQLENQTAQLIDLNKEYKKQTADFEQTIKNVASLNRTLKTLAEEFHALSSPKRAWNCHS
jgi:hypothetical protein